MPDPTPCDEAQANLASLLQERTQNQLAMAVLVAFEALLNAQIALAEYEVAVECGTGSP